MVGTFLPIWDRLKIPNPKIWRVDATPLPVKGKAQGKATFLGAHVPAKMVAGVRSRLNAGQGLARTPQDVFRAVLENGESVELANGWKLKRVRVAGEPRIEVAGVQFAD